MPSSARSKPLEHELADRAAFFEQGVCATQIRGVDRPEVADKRRLQPARVDQRRHFLEDLVLALHVVVANSERVNISSHTTVTLFDISGVSWTGAVMLTIRQILPCGRISSARTPESSRRIGEAENVVDPVEGLLTQLRRDRRGDRSRRRRRARESTAPTRPAKRCRRRAGPRGLAS